MSLLKGHPFGAAAAAMALILGLLWAETPRVALGQQLEREILARARVFPDVGPGVRALARATDGRYLILTSPGAALGVYSADGKRAGQIPTTPSKESSLLFGEDLSIDSAGRIYVVDRGGNSIKVFDPDGRFSTAIPVASPTSAAAFQGGEIAVTSMRSRRLIEVYDLHGKLVRDFGDPNDVAERADLNRFLNVGRLATDPAGNLYYAFYYLPEPTVRKYDRYGYAAQEITMTTLEYQPQAQALRREIWRQDQRTGAPSFKPVINAIGVDPQTQEVWVAIGNQLVRFDRDGSHHTSYRTYNAQGARIEPNGILIEPDRLLLVADPLGVFEFARPDKTQPQ